jgi:cytochrome c oxidase subunit 3
MTVRAVPAAASLGMWLFLASEAMFFGALFSGYVLLRAGSEQWAGRALLNPGAAAIETALLLGATAALAAGTRQARGAGERGRAEAWAAVVLALAFCAVKVAEYDAKLQAGHPPAFDLALASWYTLTFVHLLHVLGGALATAWLAGPAWGEAGAGSATRRLRLDITLRYWYFVDAVWLCIVAGFYLV